jgi:methionine sulfoxide reductase heme-binding subunit
VFGERRRQSIPQFEVYSSNLRCRLIGLPNPINRYWWNRLLRHAQLGIVAISIGAVTYALSPPPDVRHRLSMASAYAAIVYLAVSLAIGPYRIWRKIPNPVSFDFRRDVGIWAGLLATLHTIVGLTVHLRGRMWMYFVKVLHPLRVQVSLFGLANYLGAVAMLVLLLLMLISNDLSVRRLGTARWKSIQRLTYVAAVLTVAHGFAYQFVEKREAVWVAVLLGFVVVASGIQAAGFFRLRRGSSGGRDAV